MTDPLRALILEFEGTIAEIDRVANRIAYNRAFKEFGLDWSWDENIDRDLPFAPAGEDRLRSFLIRHHPEALEEAEATGLVASLHRAMTRNVTALAPLIPFRPGVQRLIYEAHLAGVRVAIVTTASTCVVDALLARDSAIRPMIDVIASREPEAGSTSGSDVYLRILAKLHVGVGACVSIEHSEKGIASARAAGIATIVTVTEGTVERDFPGAESVLTTLGDHDVPAAVLAGATPPKGIVDLDFLRQVLVDRDRSAVTPRRFTTRSARTLHPVPPR